MYFPNQPLFKGYNLTLETALHKGWCLNCMPPAVAPGGSVTQRHDAESQSLPPLPTCSELAVISVGPPIPAISLPMLAWLLWPESNGRRRVPAHLLQGGSKQVNQVTTSYCWQLRWNRDGLFPENDTSCIFVIPANATEFFFLIQWVRPSSCKYNDPSTWAARTVTFTGKRMSCRYLSWSSNSISSCSRLSSSFVHQPVEGDKDPHSPSVGYSLMLRSSQISKTETTHVLYVKHMLSALLDWIHE